jgi:hypothetical protein
VAKNKVSPSKTGQSTRGTKINLANREAEGLGGEGEFQKKKAKIKDSQQEYE